jgi:hypothetical protein
MDLLGHLPRVDLDVRSFDVQGPFDAGSGRCCIAHWVMGKDLKFEFSNTLVSIAANGISKSWQPDLEDLSEVGLARA